MTFKKWFESKQGEPYDSMFLFAKDAWEASESRMKEDALRYRWLRARIPGSTYRIMGVIYSEGGEGVDVAIDAAMAADAAQSA